MRTRRTESNENRIRNVKLNKNNGLVVEIHLDSKIRRSFEITKKDEMNENPKSTKSVLKVTSESV
ncbi:10630_t:CDS:2 [Diversispora eburnea]|uniref:10630_t:CDS:1 n=1 Tax=Diversispora eburnea TaxID=1213867 RepID=A0A9N9ATX6_9GLOM|nr:10630_t:CDS:2 [Diversispora eburnea]